MLTKAYKSVKAKDFYGRATEDLKTKLIKIRRNSYTKFGKHYYMYRIFEKDISFTKYERNQPKDRSQIGVYEYKTELFKETGRILLDEWYLYDETILKKMKELKQYGDNKEHEAYDGRYEEYESLEE